MLFKKKEKKDPLIAIQSSLSPGAQLLSFIPSQAFCQGLVVLGWGAGTSTFVKAPSCNIHEDWELSLGICCYHPFQHASGKQQSGARCSSVSVEIQETFAFGGKEFRIQTRGGYQELGAGEHARGSRLFILDQNSF